MSFLAYVLRGANDSLRAYQDQIPRAIVRMLQDCPPEAASTRKVRFHIGMRPFAAEFSFLIGIVDCNETCIVHRVPDSIRSSNRYFVE